MSESVSLYSLSLDQLMSLKTRLESELQSLTATIKLTTESVAKSQAAKEALATFAASEPGKEMLVPITESMYVHGFVEDTTQPIIDVGNGYFVKTTVPKATQFFNRRIARLNKQQEDSRAQFKGKQQQYQMLATVMNQKLRETQIRAK